MQISLTLFLIIVSVLAGAYTEKTFGWLGRIEHLAQTIVFQK